jgi:hypothetical protein
VYVRLCNDLEARVAITERIGSLLPEGAPRDGFDGSVYSYALSDKYTFLMGATSARDRCTAERAV